MSRPTLRLRGVAGCALVALTQGCGALLLPDDPPSDPRSVAVSLWTEVDEYYPWFELKGVDWNAVRDSTVATIAPQIGERELFDVLADMLEVLRDGHVSLISPYGRRTWDGWYANDPSNFAPAVVGPYLGQPTGFAASGIVSWGRLAPGIGYMLIGSFGGEGIGASVDAALRSLGALDGLVLDIRDNGGGSDLNTEAAAGRFTDHRIHYRTVRYKSGPGHEDFGPEIRDYVEPTDGERFLGPVVLLQNRRVFSAAEDFVLAMGELAQVTSVGDTTGGGSGNPIGRELPNGWLATIPRWRLWTSDGTIFEGTGLAPNEFVTAPDDELARGRDAILERALAILTGG
ncbi:MAG: S41 family peptidase [Gemmatimonadota bacterium]